MTESIKPYIPFKLVYFEQFEAETEAILREKYFKSSAGDEVIIWKNGVQLYKLTSAISKYNFIDLLSLFISGTDVYCSGVLSNLSSSTGGPSAAVIYKNGSLYKTMYDGVGYLVDAPSVFAK